MSTCQQQITSTGFENISELVPNTNLPFSIENGINALFRMTVPFLQSKTFNISLSPLATGPLNVTVTIFRVQGSTLTSIGTVNLAALTSSFVRDFSVGSYAICIRTNNLVSYNGFITETVVGFPSSALLQPIAYTGQELILNLNVPKPPRVCNQPLYFEVIEGELPPGIILNSLGRISGKLPDLDCIDPENTYSPSFNWIYEKEGSYFPWARQWRFKVRVQVADNIRAIAEEWFCIRIVNDWSKDRDNFLRQRPFIKTETIEVVEPPKVLPKSLCIQKCEAPVKVTRLQPIIPICDSCEDIVQVTPTVSEPINIQAELINGRNSDDIDHMLLTWMNIENQRNPITSESYSGSSSEVVLI